MNAIEFILEKADKPANKDYRRARKIYDACTPDEQKLIGNYADSDKVLFRYIETNSSGIDVGFVDVYPYNGNNKVGFMTMAIHPDFRRKGYANKLRTAAIEGCHSKGIKKLIYRCDTQNKESLSSIKKDNRFHLLSRGKSYASYGMDLTTYTDDERAEDMTNESGKMDTVKKDQTYEGHIKKAVKNLTDKCHKLYLFTFNNPEDNFVAGYSKEHGGLLSYINYSGMVMKIGQNLESEDDMLDCCMQRKGCIGCKELSDTGKIGDEVKDDFNFDIDFDDFDPVTTFGEESFTEAEAKSYTDKYGNKKLKGDSYFSHMETHVDEKEWRKKVEFVKIPGLEGSGYTKSQPILVIDGKNYRARSEIIVVNNKKQVLLDRGKNRASFGYDLPGGGIDPKESIEDAARRECEEEARVIPKKIKFSGIIWFMLYEDPQYSDGAASFLCVAEYGKDFKGYVKKEDKDEFADRAQWEDYQKANLGPPHKLALDRYFNGGSEFNEMEGPVVGMEKDLVYVTQYSGKHSKSKMIEGYAVSNDILSKNILVTDMESGMLKKVPTSYLKDRSIMMYEVYDEHQNLKKLYEHINKPCSRSLIYETLTGKELLTDDQLQFDEDFEPVNPIELGAEVMSEVQSMFSQFRHIPEFELTNPYYISEAESLVNSVGGDKELTVMENQHGFFGKNTRTGKRTGYFKQIKDIPLRVIKTSKKRIAKKVKER